MSKNPNISYRKAGYTGQPSITGLWNYQLMDYSQLPEDIPAKIARDHLQSFAQLVAFSHVCKSWRSAARQEYRLRLPCLLVSPHSHQDYHEFKTLTEFAALLTPTTATADQEEELPWRVRIPLGFRSIAPHAWRNRPRNNPCVASKHGWVLVIEPRNLYQPHPVKPYLLNPITREFITLPPLRRPPSPTRPSSAITLGEVRKAIITSSPDDDDCQVILAFRFEQLAWCKASPAGQDWKFTSESASRLVPCPEDVTYFGGKLYLVTRDSVHVFDNLTGHQGDITIAPISIPFSSAMCDYGSDDPDIYNFAFLSHLNNDQLFVVLRRRRTCSTCSFQDFRVYKLRLPATAGSDMTGCYDWEEARSLDGHALFLGYSHESLCLPVAPHYNGVVREDRIYFAFSFDYGFYDIGHADDPGCDWTRNDCGVFNVSNRNMESFARRPYGLGHNYFWFLPVPWKVSKKHEEMEAGWTSSKKRKDKNVPVVEAGWTFAKTKTNKNQYHQRSINNNRKYPAVNNFQALLSADDEDESHTNDDLEEGGNDVEGTP